MSKHKSTWQYRADALEKLGMTYAEYLQSEHWLELKAKFRTSKLCKKKCAVCESPQKINIHHRTYKRLGHEWLMDLIELCQNCHHKLHELDWNSEKHNLWKANKKLKRASV